jgi:hypothetical protein
LVVIAHFSQIAGDDSLLESNLAEGKPASGIEPEFGQLIGPDIFLLALGEAIQKYGPLAPSQRDERPETGTLALASTGDALLDEVTTETSIYQTSDGFADRRTEHRIRDFLAPLKAAEGFHHEDAHVAAFRA